MQASIAQAATEETVVLEARKQTVLGSRPAQLRHSGDRIAYLYL